VLFLPQSVEILSTEPLLATQGEEMTGTFIPGSLLLATLGEQAAVRYTCSIERKRTDCCTQSWGWMRHTLLEALLVCALRPARVPFLSAVSAALIAAVLQVFSCCVSPTPLQAASKNTLCQLAADCGVLG